MSVKCTLKLGETNLLWQQTTDCRAKIENAGRETITAVNINSQRGMPTLSFTCLKSGEVTYFVQSVPLDEAMPANELLPRESLDHTFTLPGGSGFHECGSYEIRAHYVWNDGKGHAESPPVRVEVIKAEPCPFTLTTTASTGVSSQLFFCAWVNETPGAYTLWLAAIRTAAKEGPKFEKCIPVANLRGSVKPVLSVPANRIPCRQYMAWVDDQKLFWVSHEHGKLESGSLDLDRPGYELLVPLLEAPFEPEHGGSKYADALLIRAESNGWQLRQERLGDGASPGQTVNVQGPAPEWGRIAYRSDAGSLSFFLSRQDHKTTLLLSSWGRGKPVAVPEHLLTWSGTLLAADLGLTADDLAVGTALLDIGPDPSSLSIAHARLYEPNSPTYVLRSWRFSSDDQFEVLPDILLRWDQAWGRIEQFILRLNVHGQPYALVRSMKKQWLMCDSSGDVSVLTGAAVTHLQGPKDILFSQGESPFILYTDSGCGFKMAPWA
jgi:hypothetical protein